MLKNVMITGALVAALGAVGLGNAEAQIIEISPFIGGYVPTADVFELKEGDVPGQAGSVTGEHKATVAFGARLTIRPTSALGVEVAGAYATGTVVTRISSGSGTSLAVDEEDDGWVAVASAKLVFDIGPVRIGGGPAVVGRGGELYLDENDDDIEGVVDVGGVVGGGVVLRLGPLGLRADVEAFFYQVELTGAAEGQLITTDAAFQSDLWVTVGFVLPIG